MTAAWVTAIPIADSADRPEWLKARATGITASDIARLMTPAGRLQVIEEKLFATGIEDNPYMAHGREREPIIAAMVETKWGISHNTLLFAGKNRQHLATPDGIGSRRDLSEIKTSTKPLPGTVPRNYRDQMMWQLHVLEAERVLLTWEQHTNGIPTDLEPAYRWLDRDEKRILELVTAADELLAYLATERVAA